MQIKIVGEQQPVSACWHLLTRVTLSLDPAGSSLWWSFKLQDGIGLQPPLGDSLGSAGPAASPAGSSASAADPAIPSLIPKMPELSKAEIQQFRVTGHKGWS